MENYPIVLGRGLVTPYLTKLRLAHRNKDGHVTSKVQVSVFSQMFKIKLNLILVLWRFLQDWLVLCYMLYMQSTTEELVHAGAATLEGALVASMNRGAKATSLRGGIKTIF
jgi:hydroxymethylglutaryl-CoA reductase (NADPH)